MSLYNKIIDIQKLSAAWQRVRRNKPAAGVDNVMWQQFDDNSREELKQLQIELREQRYAPLPVRNVTLYKGEKARVIALYSMRDKVVQQSLASELTKLFDNRLSSQSYAYRSDKSALQAIEDITTAINTKQFNAMLKLDITHFFDCIRWDLLKGRLSRVIKEEDVLELIRLNACTAMMNDVTGELTEKRVGIHQGSAIAPILSNIYMMDFDVALSKPGFFYVRYSDDMLVLGTDKQKLLELANEIKIRLQDLQLAVNETKTICCDITEGIDFLGYHLDVTGKSIPAKAEDRLYDRLETMWLTNPTLSVEEKSTKALEIIGGWQQYYKEEREMQSVYEYIAFAYAVGGRKEMLSSLQSKRLTVSNTCRDIAEWLCLLWKKYGIEELELLEYEQYYELPNNKYERISSKSQNEQLANRMHHLLLQFRKHFVFESAETAVELMQFYTDLNEFENAQYWMEQAERIRARTERFKAALLENHRVPVVLVNQDLFSPKENEEGRSSPIRMKITERTPLLMLEAFSGREDIYSIETIVGTQKRKTEMQEVPLTEQQIEEHLKGERTIGTYIQRPNATVRYIVWDIDISKQFLLKYGNTGAEFDACMKNAYRKALEIQKLLEEKGMHSYIEYSGFRGYHVWLFMSEWIPVRFANLLTESVDIVLTSEDAVSVECFPNKVRLKTGRFGQVIKIPYGIHVRSGKRSCFIDDNGEPITEIDQFINTLASYSLSAIRKALSYTMPADANLASPKIDNSESTSLRSKGKQLQSKESTEGDQGVKAGSGEDVQNELHEAYGNASASVKEILFHCSLMQYLCLKSKRTGYLTHFERLSVLHVFGHVGEEGKEFVHDVMRYTMNYQYNVTQRFIDRIPEKPVSCLKLREQYRKISAEVGCSCNFKRTKNCYPSPVLHALSLSKDMQEVITIPTSRTLTAEKEKRVIEELNVHKKAQELAVRILELKKQQRAIEKAIHKVERELGNVYDSVESDALEIEMGLLVRRKKGDGYEWVIEI